MRSTGTGPSGARDRNPGRPRQADADAFRSLMSGFPSGVAVVTTVDGSGAPRGLTCTSMCSVGLTPPSLLVCVDNRSGTLRALRESAAFAVNLLHAGGRNTAETFAGPGPDRFSRVAWEPTARYRVPRLTEDAHATAECRVLRTHPAGDHTVVIGAVEEVITGPGAPLLYGRRRFADWSGLAETSAYER
ncbi:MULTISPECIES: flavin reductase family protein [unclassified Streptomyces]|uniref:flavin reductase family protein n=1 Tax=unclassified Streptomyces TaxID=2593676 RepID=UPI0022B667F3|nr:MULTISPECIES: flavin reductase family protein [unclassified Streptomyces]MCZ7415702.1 flavin reductase family protein [Streptomyces sp. WMMC897]MCZ7434487.1 flavin reductase family protein [Streptomyces sp. WMMC1477]